MAKKDPTKTPSSARGTRPAAKPKVRAASKPPVKGSKSAEKKATASKKPATALPVDARLENALTWLRAHSSKAVRDGMSRYAIPSDHALGVAMRDIKALGMSLGRDHELALALWKTGYYEARTLTAFVADPDELTAEQMDLWVRDFDNWAYCDTLSFHLFDRTPHAWKKVDAWSRRKPEFEKRTAFALLWSLALHDKRATDAQFATGLRVIEAGASDDRNFVKKAVSMALRAIGRRRSLRDATVKLAEKLSKSKDPGAQWVGKDALRELKKR
ncbi:MAG: DNA alkylation repair protein [Polyangiaceae bacterium]